MEIVTSSWQTTVFEDTDGERKVNRKSYELCVLHKLEKALKCKEVWLEGAQAFRNPSDDLPSDWEAKREHYYELLAQEAKSGKFAAELKEQLRDRLHNFNLNLPKNQSVKIYSPNETSEKGFFAQSARSAGRAAKHRASQTDHRTRVLHFGFAGRFCRSR